MARARSACARVVVVAACVVVSLAACSAVPRLPAQGEILGARVETTVDSPIARYYLEKFLRGVHDEPEMEARIGSIHRRYAMPQPSRDDLAAISREASVDFAALFLARRLLEDERNRALNRAFARHLADAGDPPDASAYLLLFVPGWDYVDNGHATGADFARPRELATRLGLRNHLVALRPTGSIEENARIVAADIARHAGSGRKLILASASSAGPSVHLALAELVAAGDLGAVAGWVNIGGILQGSPIVEYLQSGPPRVVFEIGVRLKGWDRDAVLSLGTTRGRARFERLRIDPRILVVNYLGIPLSGQLSPHSRSNYPVLARDGPNDGLTLLADAIAPGSLTVVAPGSDHFFAEDPRIDEKTVAMMKLAIECVGAAATTTCPR